MNCLRKKIKLLILILCLVYFTSNTNLVNLYSKNTFNNSKSFASQEEKIKGVWISTVFGLDFPKEKTSDSNSLKKELDEIIKNVKDLGFNTIFFQVRPTSDSFYKSNIFPWSRYLTSAYGKEPDNNFDPLEYLIKIAHKEDIKVHAWINPYRVTANEEEKLSLENSEFLLNHKDWIIDYKNKLYFNPGIPEVNEFIAAGAEEIAKKYDIDGIQIDDYFYPGQDFSDDWSYSAYGSEFENIDDWRRNNINNLIDILYQKIKKVNKNILFGVSPSGIWANNSSLDSGSHTSGQESYFSSYADSKKWVQENKIDYIIPQIYWNIGYAGADYEILINWWNDIVKNSSVKLIIGQAAYKITESTDKQSVWYKESGIKELLSQSYYANILDNVDGYAHFRYSSIVSDPLLYENIKELNTSPTPPFIDIHTVKWAKDAIISLYNKNIVSGISDVRFAPHQKITRAQCAVMLSRLIKQPNTFKENFEDVSESMYYYEDIGSLKELGYITGIENNKFYPEKEISRQDTAVLIYRFLSKNNYINSSNPIYKKFEDDDSISDYSKEAIYSLVNENILSGYEDNTFKPKDNITRAEFSVILNKVNNLINK